MRSAKLRGNKPEHDDGGGNWVWPFMLGVIVGVLMIAFLQEARS
jgi:hypothetical protein